MLDAPIIPRCAILPVTLIALAMVGCAPGMHSVRLHAVDREERTTVPRPRPPLALPDEQFHKAVQVLARKVVPTANPLGFARQRFEVPTRGGVYVFSARTKQLRPLDEAAAAREDLPPELVEQARSYLQWCRDIHKQGDCLQILRNGGVLDAHGRYAVAMAIAQGATIEATKASLKGMANPDAVMAMLVSGMTMYLMLWVLPEPVSKGIAAVMTVVLVAYVGVDTLYTLGRGWKALVDSADKATTFEELRKAGDEFGKVMGADTARILVMLATAAMGSEAAGLAEAAPTLPGAVQASRLAVAEGGVALGSVGAVESVTIAESGLTIALAPGAMAMSSISDDFGRERATSHSGSGTAKDTRPDRKETVERSLAKVRDDPNKLHHIFDKVGRGLGPLLDRVGGQEQLIRRVLDQLVGVVPESGVFEEVIEVPGTRLVVRGAVIDGIIRLGTIFLAP